MTLILLASVSIVLYKPREIVRVDGKTEWYEEIEGYPSLFEELHRDLEEGVDLIQLGDQEFMEETGLEDNSSAEEPQEDPAGEQPVEEVAPENHVELQEEQPQQGLETIE